MKDVIDFQYERITALDKRVRELERYILELCDKNCPEDYKRVVKNEILKHNN
jgi:predicted HicB family RNase H-like nuclease|tara:strand:+ start:848 stop:1003 length:156 start_codon:yes stop_codon:yes gene_type:complete